MKVLRRARWAPAVPSPPPAPAAVSGALAARGTAFAEPDVLVALAETLPSGLNLRQAARWARNWCNASHPLTSDRNARLRAGRLPEDRLPEDRLPEGRLHEGRLLEGEAPGLPSKRWTTTLASQLDQRVLDLATDARFAHMAEVMPALAAAELEYLRPPSGAISEGVRLACGPEGVAIVPRGPWLAQAACIDAARAAWQAAGVTVGLACPSELAARRWRALTSLQDVRSNVAGHDTSARRSPGRRVLVVDAADHLSPRTLVGLLDRSASSRTKVVLVLGGTVPGNGPSVAASLDQLAEEQAGTRAVPRGLRSSVTAWPVAPDASVNGAVCLPGIVVRGSLTGADAMAHVVEAWAAEARAGPMSPLMVAFGPAEAQSLNLAARPLWLELYGRSLAAPSPPGSDLEVTLGERGYAVGDRVVALRRIGAATGATSGSVVAIGAGSVTVEWQGPAGPWHGEVGREHARSLGYGYATTVPYLRSFDQGTQRFVVLGDPLELATRSARAASAWVTVPGAGVPAFGAGGLAARRRAALAELATSWPDDEMLELAGPAPLA